MLAPGRPAGSVLIRHCRPARRLAIPPPRFTLPQVQAMTPLRKLPRKPILLCALAVVVVAVMLAWLSPREPTYRGKPLSYWLDRLPVYSQSPYNEAAADYIGIFTAVTRGGSSVSHTEMAAAVDALKAQSNQCLPMLVARLGAKSTPQAMLFFRLRLFARNAGLSRVVSMGMQPPLSASICRNQAVFALVDLGDAAKPTFPSVVKLAKTHPDPGVRASALEVLRRLSPADYAKVMTEQDAAKTGPR